MATQNVIGTGKPIEVSNGGIGTDTLTDGGVLIGATTGAIEALVVGTDGQVLVGDSANNPVFATLSSTGTIAFTTGAGTLALNARAATDALTGVVELATDAEAIAGTASTVVNCTSLKAKLGAQTANSFTYGTGTTNAIAWTAAATDGQILIGDTGSVPLIGNITSTGSSITVSNGAGTINIETGGVVDAFSGFASWDGAGPYFDDTVLGDFTISQSGTGFINGVSRAWTAPQTIGSLAAGNTYYIYIDSAGDIQKTTAYAESLFQDNIVLFECMRDSTAGTNLQVTVKENHSYKMPPKTSTYLHRVVGSVISNRNNGANIVIATVPASVVKIAISGEDFLEDHGLETAVSDSGGVAVTWKQYFTLASGKWAQNSSTDAFVGEYNNAGAVAPLTGGKFGVYTLYVSKDNLNAATPVYFAVLDDAQYNNINAAQTAVANGTTAQATTELEALEFARLGYIIFKESTTAIIDIIIDKETLRSTSSTSGTNQASLVLTDVTNFDGILSASDTTVQAALETIDDWGDATTDHAVLIGNGSGSAISSLAVGTDGQVLVGDSADDPVFATLSSTGTIAFTLGAGTLALNARAATDALTGVVELATDAEAIAGTASTVVNCTSLKAKLGTQTDHGVLVGSSTTGAITALTVGTDGQVLLGDSADDPAFATLTSTGTIAFTPGAHALALDCRAATTAVTGVVELATDAEAIAGGAGSVAIIPTSLKAKLGVQTSHGLPYGAGTAAAIAWTAEPTDGQILIGETGAVPQLGTLTAGTGVTVSNSDHAITVASTGTTLKNETGTTYTFLLSAGDEGKFFTFTNEAAITVTVPTNAAQAFPIGSIIGFQQGGAGKVTFSGAVPPTLKSADNAYTTVKLYSVGCLVKIASDVWAIGGDMEA